MNIVKTFAHIDMSEFEGYEFSESPDASAWDAPWHSAVVPSLEFYAVVIFNTNTGREFTRGQSEPACKNMSGEQCVDGWCGTTNNVDVSAIGKWQIVSANRLPSVGNGSQFRIEAERLQ